jgi:hypothetical protein
MASTPPHIHRVIKDMRTRRAIKLYKGATAKEILACSRILHARLPESYVTFLRLCGWANINGDVVAGIGRTAKGDASIVDLTVSAHLDLEPPLPYWLIPVHHDGSGNYECLDSWKVAHGECPVVLWNHEHPRREKQRPMVLQKSFSQWLESLVESSGA